MTLSLFKTINQQLERLTHEVCYHIVGDPIVLSNLNDYLDISHQYNLNVNITTAAALFNKNKYDMLSHTAIKQINFSLNSFNANTMKQSLEEYLDPILNFCSYILNRQQDIFINLRLWNLDKTNTAQQFNRSVIQLANQFFNTNIDYDNLTLTKKTTLKLARKIHIHFDDYFTWPSLQNPTIGTTGFCYGLQSHFGILSNGDVVPCCLDKDGIITLGNVNNKSIIEILNDDHATTIKNNFFNKKVTEELCQKCSFRKRFD